MKTKIVLFITTSLLALTNYSQTTNDYDKIKTTLNYYLEGGTNNDFNLLKKAFHENATMSYINDDKYVEVNAINFFKKVIKPGPKQNRTTKIDYINVSGKVANAKITITYKSLVLVDYLNLIKINNAEWKIVNKVYDRFPKNKN
ncbi:nuclear transport factor 2 family protein [Yeosuana marina]|uniref:nuclear transport factor 2 family protein n=1 Tax=Yeosuana marina TaxID=1565536 RepID=UPI00141F1A82|nr:nuclear transport factor 2 family protein [Yeosuana marina]